MLVGRSLGPAPGAAALALAFVAALSFAFAFAFATLSSPGECRVKVFRLIDSLISEIGVAALSLVGDRFVDGPELVVVEAWGHVWHVLRNPSRSSLVMSAPRSHGALVLSGALGELSAAVGAGSAEPRAVLACPPWAGSAAWAVRWAAAATVARWAAA